MVFVEIVTVLGGIAAMVSAYKDVGSRFRRWKSKKEKAKVGPESAALETSLNHVPNELWHQCSWGSSLGPAFTKGDDIAKNSMEKVLLNFTTTFLEYLQQAISGIREPDLNRLLDTSESTGRETISILKDLHQRVLQAIQIPRNLSPEVPPPLPPRPTQEMLDLFREDRVRNVPDRMSVISRNSSIRSSLSTSTSEDVLQANLERFAQHAAPKMPSTSMNAVAPRCCPSRSNTSADVLRRNKRALTG